MISSYLRKRLVLNIESLGPEEFHWVALNFLSTIINKTILSTGVNRNNKAVGYANDAVSIDGKTVAEFSTEEGYFTWKKRAKKKYEKANGDIQHALKLQGGVEEVYLISSQKCTPFELQKMRKELARKFKRISRLHIFNSESIADVLIAGIEKSEAFTDEIEKYLVEISYIKAEQQHNANFPKTMYAYYERSCELEILKLLNTSKSVVMYGLSGCGKTELLKKIGEKSKQHFEYRIWINAGDLVDETSFAKVNYSRLGKTANVLEIMKTYKTLVCIDSMEGKLPLLEALVNSPCADGSRIIVSSQISYTGKDIVPFEVGGVDLDTFNLIMNHDLEENRHCSKEQSEDFHRHTNGYVIVASVLNRYVKYNDFNWADLKDINSAIESLEDHKNQKIIEFLLKKYSSIVKTELEVLKGFRSKLVEPNLLSKMISVVGVSNLQRRSLINKEENGLFKIHDLIFKALEVEVASGDQYKKFAMKLLSVLESQLNLDEGMSNFSHSLLVHKELILHLGTDFADSRTMYLGLLALGEGHLDESQYEEFKSFEELKVNILNDKFKLFSFVEFNECRYRKMRYIDKVRKDDYNLFLKETIANYDYLLSQEISLELKLYLFHHRGKAKNLINDLSAKQDYEESLKIKSDFHAGMLQLFKFEAKNDFSDKPNYLIETILEAASKDSSKVSLSILLACFQDLRKVNFNKSRKRLIKRYGTLFKRTILLSTVDGYSFAYETLAGFGHDLGLVNKKIIKDIYKLIDFPLPTVNDDKKRLNTGLALRSIGSTLHDPQISSKASAYFEGINFKEIPPYQASHIAFFYIDLGEYKKALEILNTIEEKDRDAFVCLRFSQAYLGLKEKEAAERWIGPSIEKLASKYKEKHLASFVSVKKAIESLSS